MRDDWPAKLDADIKRDMGVETVTVFDLLGEMRYVTTPADCKTPLPDSVHDYIKGWMSGRAAATGKEG